MIPQLSVLRQAWAHRLQRLRFHCLGPTTVHLELEVYLLLSMLLLAIGSLRGLYKESFGSHAADYYLVGLIGVTLSRHLFFRLYVTWDPSTHASPSGSGLLSHFLQSYITAGQTVDRPPPLPQLSLMHHVPSSDRTMPRDSTAAASSSALNVAPSPADRLLQITGGYLETSSRDESIPWSAVLPSVLLYALQIPRQYLWFPLTRLLGGTWLQGASTRSSHPISLRRRKKASDPDAGSLSWWLGQYRTLQHYTIQLLCVYGPSLQFLLTSKVCCDGLVLLLSLWSGSFSWLDDYDSPRLVTTLLTIHTHDATRVRQAAEHAAARMVGHYHRQGTPTMSEVWGVLLVGGTLGSCLLCSRILWPLPDLVAGGNVARGPVTSAAGRKGARAAAPTTRLQVWWKKLRASSTTSDSAAWAERQHALASAPRGPLHGTVLLGRVLEHVLVVGLLPRTRWAGRAMGHCPAGPSVWELSRRLFPGGLRGPPVPAAGDGERDPFSALWAVGAVILISFTLLAAQGIVLNRSYLALAAYRAREWERVSSKTAAPPTSAPVWETKRKYPHGDLVYYPDRSGALYRSRVPAPEGHPLDLGFRWFGEALLAELGHPATSGMIAHLVTIQYVAAVLYFLVWALRRLLGWSAPGLAAAVLAHLVAVQGLLAVTRSARYTVAGAQSESMRALQALNAEILQPNT
jgi:hypothetical protein